MNINDNEVVQLKLGMTSNTAPSPYHIEVISSVGLTGCTQNDFYKLFDNDNSTSMTFVDRGKGIIELDIGRNILLRKYSASAGNAVVTLYGYNENTSDYEIINNNTNEKMYKKYKIEITVGGGAWYGINEVSLFILAENKLIKTESGFIGIDRTNDIPISFDDIYNNNLYTFNKYYLNNIEILQNKYPFKILKLVPNN